MSVPDRSHSADAAWTAEPATDAVWVWAALGVAVVGLAGSLYLSLGMNLKACPLCFYQRTFMMSLVAILSVGLVANACRPGRLAVLALPLAIAGLGVALFHVSLEVRGKLECPGGVLGLGTAPQQSLAAFVALTALLALDTVRRVTSRVLTVSVPAVAIALGVLLALGSCSANPPMPGPPQHPYSGPPDICRPPYQNV